MNKLQFTALALAVAAGTAHANSLGEDGFSGEITALIGFTSEESNFNTDNKRKDAEALTIENLNSAGNSESGITVAPLGQIRYTFDDNQVFIGTSRDDIAVGDFALEVGYSRAIGNNSVLSLSYLPSLGGETWQDPYVLNQDRETADISSHAFRVKYKSVLGSPFSADLAYFTKELDKETSGAFGNGGQTIAELDRNGNGIYSKFSYAMPMASTGILEPSLIYKQFSADGKAMSNSTYGFELAYQQKIGHHAWSVSGNYEITSFDAEHSFFEETQKDSTFGMFGAYEYEDMFGWKDVSFNSISGFEMTSSNIAFYDSVEFIVGVGASYSF